MPKAAPVSLPETGYGFQPLTAARLQLGAATLADRPGGALVHYRFTRNQRVLTKSDFNRVFSKPTSRLSNKYLLLLVRQGDTPTTRLGLVMSKKNVGNAVKRNRIKRLCRECFRQHAASLPPADLVLLAKPGISLLKNSEIAALILGLFDKLQGQ